MDKESKAPSLLATIGAVFIIVTLGVMLLVRYTFDGPGLGTTWPALFVAAGVVLMMARYLELGIGVTGLFGIFLAANLDAFSLKRAWPFFIIIVAIAVVVGFLRARAGKSPGPESTIRE